MCKTEDCNKPVRARNLCQYHYNRDMRHRYVNEGVKDIHVDNPHPRTLKAKEEFNAELWEFVRNELKIQ